VSPSDSRKSGSTPHTSSHGHSGEEPTKRSLSASKQKGNCNASLRLGEGLGFGGPADALVFDGRGALRRQSHVRILAQPNPDQGRLSAADPEVALHGLCRAGAGWNRPWATLSARCASAIRFMAMMVSANSVTVISFGLPRLTGPDRSPSNCINLMRPSTRSST
jgi:hypothetical protein